MRSGLVQAAIAVFALGLLISFPSSAFGGATFSVTRLDDPLPNGCQPSDCSLREAVIDANSNPGHDTINLRSGTMILERAGTGEDASATGDLDVNDDTTILGSGAEVDAQGIDRVFDIGSDKLDEAITVEIRNLTVLGGITGIGDDGAGIRVGDSSGTMLILRNSVVRNNMSGDDGGGVATCCGSGAEITDVVVRNNLTSLAGGGLFHCCSSASYTLTRAQILDNAALEDGGGAFFCCVSTATLTDVAISDNYAGDQGGGLYHCCNGSEHQMNLSGATIDGNTAETEGGGFYNCCAGTTLMITNVTISGNTAKSKGGGYHNEHSEGALTRFTNLTIAGNTAPMGAGIYNGEDDNVTIINTIVAANANGADCAGKAVDLLGNNLDGDGSCAGGNGTDPLLSPLADNGGFSETHALTGGSPATDAGDDAQCPATDQRGVARPQGAHCDIGAFELEVATPQLTWGDVDCDGTVGTRDSQALLRNVLEQPPLSQTGDCPLIGAPVTVDGNDGVWGDVDCDGTVGTRDSQALLRNVLEQPALSQTPPCPLIGALAQVSD